MEICGYGCGREAKYPPRKGMPKWCCESNWSKCPVHLNRMKINNPLFNAEIKRKHKLSCSSEKTKEKHRNNILKRNPMSDPEIRLKHRKKMKTLTGKNNPLYTNPNGIKNHFKSQRSEKTRKIKSDSAKKSYKDGKHPCCFDYVKKKLAESLQNYYRNMTKEDKKQLSKIHLYKIEKLKEIYPLFFNVEEVKLDNKDLYLIQVHCKNHNCENSKEKNGWFTPTRNQLYERIRGIYSNDGSYFYCCEKCKNECVLYGLNPTHYLNNENGHENKRSVIPKWLIDETLELFNNECIYCGSSTNLIIHHILPVKLYPNLELDKKNFLVCCKKCHYRYAHKTGTECSTGNLATIVCNNIKEIE